MSKRQLAKSLDHSLLIPTVTDEDVKKGCEIARRFDVASVSVKPCHIELAASLLQGSNVLVGTVVGFPHGGENTRVKVFETQDNIERGGQEIDMVMNVGLFLSGRYEYVQEDIAAVRRAMKPDMLLKVIIEVAYLNEGQIVKACQVAEAAGADFVKTSSGFAPSGATVEVVRLMRRSVSQRVQVKAAYGIRNYETLVAMLEAGASRCAVRCTEEVMKVWDERHPAR